MGAREAVVVVKDELVLDSVGKVKHKRNIGKGVTTTGEAEGKDEGHNAKRNTETQCCSCGTRSC